jgi:APA family basic amino acid/polyamine antiporter
MSQPVFSHKRAMCLIAGNAIGTGIFTTTGFALRDLGSPWYVLALWVLGGIYALLGVYSYSILHQKFPGSGGEYNFLSKGIHPKLGSLAGFATILMGFTAPLAASAMAFAIYFLRAIPLNVDPVWVSLFALTFVFLLLYSSLHQGMKWHDFFIYIKLILFVLMILIAFFVAEWHWPVTTMSFNIYTFAKSFFWIAYAYSGWNAVYYVASELTSDHKKVDSASIMGSSIVIALYVFLNIPLLFGVSNLKLSGAPEVMAVFFEANTGLSTEQIISGVIALGLLSTISSFYVIVPRIYTRMAEDKVIPQFFYFPPGTHPKRVLIFQFIFTALFLVLFNFESILSSAGFVLTSCSLLSVMSLYFTRNNTLTTYQILGSLAYISLTSVLIYFGGPWF